MPLSPRFIAARLAAAAGWRLSHLAARLNAPPEVAEERPASPHRTLSGDRDVEWSWCLSRLPAEPGRVLDFGAGNGFLSLGAAFHGHSVVAVDLEPKTFQFEDERIEYRRGNLLDMELPDASFDHIINCSSVEHVGLAGRYGSPDIPDGDLAAMAKLRAALKPGKTMTLVVPTGRDAVVAPLHRIYGRERLPRLVEGFEIVEEEFRAKIAGPRWHVVDRDTALNERGSSSYYALGLFLLRRPT